MRTESIATVGTAATAIALWLGRGTLEHWFFSKVIGVVDAPNNLVGVLAEYGPPAIFALITAGLLYRIIRSHYGKPHPDIPIRDLFFQLDPTLLDDETRPDSPWEIIGQDIIDRLSTGQIHAWGREMNPQQRTKPAPLVPIPQDRWARAEFSYFFIAEDHSKVMHVECARPERGSAPWQYSDLHFNRYETLRAWPRKIRIRNPFVVSRS